MAEIILTVVLEVVKCLAPLTERQISYLRSYNNSLENLKNEIENLKNVSEIMKHNVDEAKRNGEEIENNVQEWLVGVSKIITEAEKFVGDEVTTDKHCFKGLCPNLKTRHRLSKEVVRLREAIVKLRQDGRFDRISYRTIPEDDTLLMSNKDYYDLESRKTTLKKILGALKDPDVNMLGIYGMGGIGKTTLAKEVARQAEIDKLFDQVIFVEVSLSQDIRKIQGEIGDKLGLSFHGESEAGRARSLCSRLKKEKRILVILDNIWENLDLLAVGIPHGDDDHKGCKILLTARSEDVLSRKMDSQQNFQVGVLEEEEAWSLFKKMTGDYIEGSQFKTVATDVAKECAGLPVSIVTVAKALRNKRLFEWVDALQQLRRPTSMNFRHIQPKACSAIELSYSKLEGEELKKCFLLIGYTYITSINDLLMYGMGLGFFEGINKMEEARARVRTLVQKLKASCMLLDQKSKNEECFSMHDVVRDVAKLIASQEKNVFSETGELVNGWEWSSASTIKLCTSIVLYNVKTNVLPEVLNCPQLKFFYVRATEKSSLLSIPDDLFTEMIQVRVIDLTNMHLLSLPSSLSLLANLQTLRLYECKLQDISVIGDLKNLEILCLEGSEIKRLPTEVGQLTLLRSLDLRGCKKLEVIPPNVLSKLSHLEELHIASFDKWEEEVGGLKNASVDELKHLHNLTSLQLSLKEVNTLPRDLLFDKLERYHIWIGGGSYCWPINGERIMASSRKFKLQLNTNICLKYGIIVPLQGIEVLGLYGLQEQDIKYFVNELIRVGPPQLKHLQVSSKRPKESTSHMQSKEIIFDDNALFLEKVALPNLETLSLYSISVERIWQSQLAAMSCGIQNLTALIVHDCRNLRCLFSSSIVSSFVRLEYLLISSCPVLEEITVVDQAEMENDIVIFPQLQFLGIEHVEKLKGFSTGDVHVEFPSLTELAIRECPEFTHDLTKLVSVFPNLESLRVDANRIAWILQLPEGLVCKLKHLDVILDEATTILSLDVFFKRFHTIQILQMDGGKITRFSYLNVENAIKATIREVNKFVDVNQILKHSAILDNLKILQIAGLVFENLTNLMPSTTTFQNLTTLEVWFCHGLIQLLTSSTIKNLIQLRQMYIGECNMLTEIVSKDDEGDTAAKDEIVFSNLKELVLFCLQSLTSFCFGNCTFKFPSLERLVVENCPKMKIFSGGELSTPSLRKIQRYRHKESDSTWKGDLNTTIQHLYLETMVSVFPNLESLGVEAKHIPWILQLAEDRLWKLKHLDVILDESVTILSFDDFFKRFHNIQILQIDGGKIIRFSYLNVENAMKATIREVNKFVDVNQILKHSAILDNLEILQIAGLVFENLINLMPSTTTFQNLTTLEVWFCHGLIQLLTSSTIKNLVQLRQMYIGECNMLTEIVSKDDEGDTAAKDEIVFSNLKELVLFCLQSLTSFCFGNFTFKFPSLERLVVENCPKMKIFSGGELSTPNLRKIQRYRHKESDSTWKGDLNTTIQHLYLEIMVSVVPNLESLGVEAKHIPWILQLAEDRLWKLKHLDVILDESATILSFDDFFKRFHNIQILQIDGGKITEFSYLNVENAMKATIREVNEFADVNQILKHSAILDNLEILQIAGLVFENLINLMPSTTTFQNLTTLEVWFCHGLIQLLTSSTIKNLVQLRQMYIGECNMLTEIVSKDDEGDTAAKDEIVFSNLKELVLFCLQSLTSFCFGNFTFKFPSLERLVVENCPKMKIFSGGELSTPNLRKIQRYRHTKSDSTWKGDLNTTIQHLYLETMVSVVPNLESLGVEAKHIPWILQLAEDRLWKLKHLDVILDESATILSFDDFFKRFHNIQILQIDGGEIIRFSYLNVENAMKATIREVNKFVDVNQILKHSAILDNLEILQIAGLVFENLINLMPSTTTFQNLTTLEVWFCHGLTQLLTSSTIKNLVQLRQMYIGECNMLTEIVSKDDEGDTAAKDEIVFSNLKELVLFCLQSLTSFCFGNCTFKFPSLERLVVENCPKMMIFSGGELSTPNLRKIQRYRHKESDSTWKGDLNTTIQHLYLETMVSVVPNLESLGVEAKHIPWILQLAEDRLWKLKHLDVILDESATILSFDDFFKRFHNIQILQIDGGKITEFSYLNVENAMKATIREVNEFADVNQILKHSAILDNLEILQIAGLVFENLINLMPSTTTFQNLTTLEVWFCHGLIQLLTSSTIKNLVQLRQMYIGECNMLTEIVSKDDEGDTAAKDEIVFSNLKELVLFCLQSLTSFCFGNCTFKFPSLERLVVENCPKMKIFSGGELSTPNLRKIQRYRYKESDSTWKGDLNTTIQHLYLETMEINKGNHEKKDTEGCENQISKEDFGNLL